MTEPSRDWRAASVASRIAAQPPESHDEILNLIRRARRRYRVRLHGGNCGQFAYALGKLLGRGEIALLTEAGLEEDDLRHGDADVYHVLLQVDGRLYDGGGEADAAGLARLAEAEYGDGDPTLWSGFPLDEDTRLIISGQTSWNTEWTDFYRFLEGPPKSAAEAPAPERGRTATASADFSKGDPFFLEPTKEGLRRLRGWLRANRNTFVTLYHGTSAGHNVAGPDGEGLLPTSPGRAKSLQSARGWVHLSVHPDMAETFGRMAYPGQDVSVYAVTVPVHRLRPDADQLRNMRYWSGDEGIGGDLASSLVHGSGARVRGALTPYSLALDHVREAGGPGAAHRRASGAPWAYHATDAAKLRAIAEEGLVPREQPEEHADEDRGEEGAVVFFCPEERLAAAWGGAVLRFPWPEESWEDPYGDATWSAAGGAGYTNHCTPLRIPPELIEVKLGGAWVPLVPALRRAGSPDPRLIKSFGLELGWRTRAMENIDSEQTADELACLSCGTALSAGATECPECGFPFSRRFRERQTEGNAARTAARLAKWRGRLRDEYADYDEWCRYSDTYGLAARLGFPSNEAAWEANPMVEGSTNPADYRTAPKRKQKSPRPPRN